MPLFEQVALPDRACFLERDLGRDVGVFPLGTRERIRSFVATSHAGPEPAGQLQVAFDGDLQLLARLQAGLDLFLAPGAG